MRKISKTSRKVADLRPFSGTNLTYQFPWLLCISKCINGQCGSCWCRGFVFYFWPLSVQIQRSAHAHSFIIYNQKHVPANVFRTHASILNDVLRIHDVPAHSAVCVVSGIKHYVAAIFHYELCSVQVFHERPFLSIINSHFRMTWLCELMMCSILK